MTQYEAKLDGIFEPGGLLQQHLSHYEFRPSQLQMAEAVVRAIEELQHLCLEAGTGTGKTLAYLIPALASDRRVIISTATKNLQEQLFFRDLPFLQEHLFQKVRVTYMKGRQNYICLKKFEEASRQKALAGELAARQQALSDWIAETETGDRAELDWISDQDPLWRQLDARSETCVGQKCDFFEQCPITRMRQRALESDIIIVNHALLFANLALESDEIGRILPEFSILVLDEAHEVEAAACTYFGKRTSSYQIEELCRDLLKVYSDGLYDREVADLESRTRSFCDAFPAQEGRHPFNFFDRDVGETLDLREEAAAPYQHLKAGLHRLYHSLHRQSPRPAEGDALIRRLEQLIFGLEEVFEQYDPNSVYWLERRGRGVFVNLSPIDVSDILQEKVFARTDTTVLTSATLSTNGNFEYLKERLGVPEPIELIVPSEFDYLRQAILYLPGAFPEPRSPLYLDRLLEEVRQILSLTEGHAFLLFTSFQQMNRIYEALLETSMYPLLRQGDAPKNQLLETFKQTPNAVLLATSSFWQGVDVQGDALRAVIIDKLPFLVPTEPVVAARMKRLEKQGINSFLRYSVPQAIIALRQGLGRLIRSRQDRGILAIFDSRLRTRSYGQLFLESLPNCPVTDNMASVKEFLSNGARTSDDGSSV